MALASSIVWEVRSTGAQTNGGGFKTGASGTDYSQQAAAQYALTSAVSTVATAVITHASASAPMVGNTCRVVSGTNATLGWYEVISVVEGTSLTVDRNWCTAAAVSAVVNVGGAFKIGGTLDDKFFDAHVAGNTIYIASTAGGVTYTLGEGVAALTAGTALLPITFEAYKDTRGTVPTGADRPTIACGTNILNFNTYRIIKYIIFTSSQTYGVQIGGYSIVFQCKSTQSSATANFYAFYIGTATSTIECETVSTNGYAIGTAYSDIRIINCYIHDSGVGVFGLVGRAVIAHNIIDTCTTGIAMAGSSANTLLNNTIYNCTTGISGTTAYSNCFINNIITGCTTGASWTTEEFNNFWDYNCWNNTTDVSNVVKGPHDITADPLLNNPAAGDFTLAAGSPCFDAGLQPGAEIGL